MPIAEAYPFVELRISIERMRGEIVNMVMLKREEFEVQLQEQLSQYLLGQTFRDELAREIASACKQLAQNMARNLVLSGDLEETIRGFVAEAVAKSLADERGKR